ncbi:MAG: hypothetical protein M1296_00720, partial [Chloroflexi bacterium]|nr:hypothetical protein [Chloroflexota bacterium]
MARIPTSKPTEATGTLVEELHAGKPGIQQAKGLTVQLPHRPAASAGAVGAYADRPDRQVGPRAIHERVAHTRSC